MHNSTEFYDKIPRIKIVDIVYTQSSIVTGREFKAGIKDQR